MKTDNVALQLSGKRMAKFGVWQAKFKLLSILPEFTRFWQKRLEISRVFYRIRLQRAQI
jgi:hypothetical protein